MWFTRDAQWGSYTTFRLVQRYALAVVHCAANDGEDLLFFSWGAQLREQMPMVFRVDRRVL
jgi:hypothetical protein